MKHPEIIYFDHAIQTDRPSPPFTSGEAGFVWVNEAGELTSDIQVDIPPNTVHALQGHGVVDELDGLELFSGGWGGGRDVVVAPGDVEEVTRLLYEADRMTYGAVHDLLVETVEDVEYRIVIDNREYQRTLSRLQFLSGTAARLGRGLRFRL
ncbi:MAG: hypothetical protein VCC04_14880 [Myxococcota bacterium]